MSAPTRPTDLLVTNGWYMEGLPGLVSPHFETFEGIQKTSNSVELVDAGSNRKYKFPTQIIDQGEMTLTRTHQNNSEDIILENLAEAMISLGVKVNCFAVKRHHLQEVFRIAFEGFRIVTIAHPSWDVNGEDKFIVSYTVTCDGWTRI